MSLPGTKISLLTCKLIVTIFIVTRGTLVVFWMMVFFSASTTCTSVNYLRTSCWTSSTPARCSSIRRPTTRRWQLATYGQSLHRRTSRCTNGRGTTPLTTAVQRSVLAHRHVPGYWRVRRFAFRPFVSSIVYFRMFSLENKRAQQVEPFLVFSRVNNHFPLCSSVIASWNYFICFAFFSIFFVLSGFGFDSQLVFLIWCLKKILVM